MITLLKKIFSRNRKDTQEDIPPTNRTVRFEKPDFSRTLAGEPQLEVTLPDKTKRVVDLNRSEIRIGREVSNSLVLPIGSVSGEHARIFYESNEYFIEDLGSTNGTVLNGVKIARSVLRHLDSVDLGEAVLVFVERS